MTDAVDEQQVRRPVQRLSPERVRTARFSRTPIGRRGLNEDEIVEFLHRVADELAARDAAEASLRAKVTHYKNTLIQWQREQLEARGEETSANSTLGSAPRPSVAAVNLLSQAQQQADAYVAQTQEYCRRLAADAQDHAQEILSEARAQAQVVADDAAHAYEAHAGTGSLAEVEDLERRLLWARAFITSLESVEAQLRTAREALAYEFDKLDRSASAADATN
jgi:cell division septum initiation protein DivIVA